MNRLMAWGVLIGLILGFIIAFPMPFAQKMPMFAGCIAMGLLGCAGLYVTDYLDRPYSA